MSMMMAEVYDALKAAGAPEEQARKAAEALANYDNRFGKIEADLLVLKWMVGALIAVNISVILKTIL